MNDFEIDYYKAHQIIVEINKILDKADKTTALIALRSMMTISNFFSEDEIIPE